MGWPGGVHTSAGSSATSGYGTLPRANGLAHTERARCGGCGALGDWEVTGLAGGLWGVVAGSTVQAWNGVGVEGRAGMDAPNR